MYDEKIDCAHILPVPTCFVWHPWWWRKEPEMLGGGCAPPPMSFPGLGKVFRRYIGLTSRKQFFCFHSFWKSMGFLELGQTLSQHLKLQAWSSKIIPKIEVHWKKLEVARLQNSIVDIHFSLKWIPPKKSCWLKRAQSSKLCPPAIPAPIKVA